MRIDPQPTLLQDCCSDSICPSRKPYASSRGDPAASASCLSSLRVTVWSLAFVHSSPCLLMLLFIFLLFATPHFLVLSHCLVAEMWYVPAALAFKLKTYIMGGKLHPWHVHFTSAFVYVA